MKKTKINLILYIFMFLFAELVVFSVCRQSDQAVMSIPIPFQLVSEYSRNGGEWQILSEETICIPKEDKA